MLSSLDSIHISAVLEDCVDQLAILGHIMPATLEGKSDAAKIVDDELGQILQDQRDLESRYEVVRIKRMRNIGIQIPSREMRIGSKNWGGGGAVSRI